MRHAALNAHVIFHYKCEIGGVVLLCNALPALGNTSCQNRYPSAYTHARMFKFVLSRYRLMAGRRRARAHFVMRMGETLTTCAAAGALCASAVVLVGAKNSSIHSCVRRKADAMQLSLQPLPLDVIDWPVDRIRVEGARVPRRLTVSSTVGLFGKQAVRAATHIHSQSCGKQE